MHAHGTRPVRYRRTQWREAHGESPSTIAHSAYTPPAFCRSIKGTHQALQAHPLHDSRTKETQDENRLPPLSRLQGQATSALRHNTSLRFAHCIGMKEKTYREGARLQTRGYQHKTSFFRHFGTVSTETFTALCHKRKKGALPERNAQTGRIHF